MRYASLQAAAQGLAGGVVSRAVAALTSGWEVEPMGFFAKEDVYAPCSCGSGKKYKFCCLAKDRQERRARQEEVPIPW